MKGKLWENSCVELNDDISISALAGKMKTLNFSRKPHEPPLRADLESVFEAALDFEPLLPFFRMSRSGFVSSFSLSTMFVNSSEATSSELMLQSCQPLRTPAKLPLESSSTDFTVTGTFLPKLTPRGR
jgi:hypothetical protein